MYTLNNITQKELKERLHYNPDTGVFTWLDCVNRRVQIGSVAGTLSNKGYNVIRINNIRYRAARLAWLYMTGTFPDCIIDHINRIRNDDRFINLRDASVSENNLNSNRCINIYNKQRVLLSNKA